MEMQRTQRIIKVCDSNFYDMPGYIQHFQVNPFGTHLYTEVGLSILVQHLGEKRHVSLYLDATGGVVSKIPEQSKRVLYYALTLPGRGRDAPPLPVCEMLSNEHSIPPTDILAYAVSAEIDKVHQAQSSKGRNRLQMGFNASCFLLPSIDKVLKPTWTGPTPFA